MDDYDRLDALSDLEKLRYRYNHADCDDLAFALNVLMQWDIVCINDKPYGAVHRLVVTPGSDRTESEASGFKPNAMVDFNGYVTEADLMKRYNIESGDFEFVQAGAFLGPTINTDKELRRMMHTFLCMPTAPFNTPAFQTKVTNWIENGCHFEDEAPRAKKAMRPGH